MLTLALKNHALLLRDVVRAGPRSQGRLTPRRAALLAVFVPAYATLQCINAAGLLMDRLLFPGFRGIEVRHPVFVVGMPRSGTTFLHRLLARDESRFTSMKLWELLFAPSITQRCFWRAVGRIDRAFGRPAGRILDATERAAFGWFGDVHQTGLQDAEEDYLALSLVGACFLLVLPFPYARVWRLAYFDEEVSPEEQRQVMAFYRGIIQRHLYVHGTDRCFLSKNPSFTPMVGALANTFPEAQFIACYRDPQSAAPSLISSLQQGARLFDHRDPRTELGQQLIAMLKHYAFHLLSILPSMERAQYAFVAMEDVTTNPAVEVKQLYARLGWTPTAEYEAVLATEAERASGYRSQHRYSLAGLGLDGETIERELGLVTRQLANAD